MNYEGVNVTYFHWGRIQQGDNVLFTALLLQRNQKELHQAEHEDSHGNKDLDSNQQYDVIPVTDHGKPTSCLLSVSHHYCQKVK